MDGLSIMEMIIVATISMVVTSAVWAFLLQPKIERELEEACEELAEINEDQKLQIKSLLRDNKRMLATLNHYNIKKAVPLYPNEEAKRDGRR